MKLAIKGHSTRGKEVIELLEMIGGVNPFSNNGEVIGNKEFNCYYISENATLKYISWDYIGPEEINEYIIFTLEEFKQKFPYKVGDKVRNARINDFIGRITNARWDDNENQIIYVVEWDDVIKSTLTYFARGLQPYK